MVNYAVKKAYVRRYHLSKVVMIMITPIATSVVIGKFVVIKSVVYHME